MTYELAEQLKEAGFPQHGYGRWESKAMGTYTCRYCGKDTPHYHRVSKDGPFDPECHVCAREKGRYWEENTYSLPTCPYHGGKPKRQYENHQAVYIPTLSELIEACGGGLKGLSPERTMGANPKVVSWGAFGDSCEILNQSSPEEAVAELWLTVNKGGEPILHDLW